MSLSKRHIETDGDMPVRDLLKLLDVPGNSIVILVDGEPVLVEVHTEEAGQTELTRAEKWERSLHAMEEFRKLVDLYELERYIHEGRENDPIKPPVILDSSIRSSRSSSTASCS